MREKRTVLITFDYELFLGEQSGIVHQCLIEPTNKLLDCLNKYAFKAVFFIDTVYLLRLKEVSAEYDRAKTGFYNNPTG
jgi:peptidoglycan/xylan/chitin deacetylase (PgdA/CDA1 family)